jgi:hypothetical protein
MFAHRHSDGLEQFNQAMAAVEGSPEIVRLGRDGRSEDRFTSREMIAVEERLHRAAEIMAERERHAVYLRSVGRTVSRAEERGLVLSREQRTAFAHVTESPDLGIVVGYVRSALTGLAAEYSGLEIPDYSQTLGKILGTSEVTTKYLNVIAKLPALQQTPDKLAEQMIAAGKQLRKYEQESLQNACNLFRRERNELSQYMHHHRQAVDQDRLVVRTGLVSVAVGLLLYALFAGPLVRLMPESWLLPDRVAARVLRMDPGIRLIQTAAPERWNDIVSGLRIVVKNRGAITKCEEIASKEAFPVPCVVEMGK